MVNVPEMKADFARWYAEAFMDEGEKRELRWKGVASVTANADYPTAEVLTRLAFQTPVPASGRKTEDLTTAYEKVVSLISGGDVAFDPLQSERELQVLAASALNYLVETMPDAAIMVTTASFGGHRKPKLPMDIVAKAENALAELSARKHARVSGEELRLPAQKVNFEFASEEPQEIDSEQSTAQLEQLQAAITAAIQSVVAGQNRVVQLLHKQILLDEEELQILWWLLGEYSKTQEKPFSQVAPEIRTLALPYELGRMTVVSPGPASIGAMLARTGIGAKKTKVADVVNAADLEWVKSVSASKLVSPVTTPIHFALEQRAELGTNDAWLAGWAQLTGLSADVALPGVRLAELFYREHVFINIGE